MLQSMVLWKEAADWVCHYRAASAGQKKLTSVVVAGLAR